MLNRQTQANPSDFDNDKLPKSSPSTPNQDGVPDVHQNPSTRSSFILAMPAETLTGITAYLDPPSLKALSEVNRLFYQHVKDDNTWHRAFVYQFLGIGPESELRDDVKSLMLRRSERSWRNEFVVRYNLRRRWERSRNPTVAHSPVHSRISSMHLLPSHGLLSASLKYGIVSRSLPLTGKILAGYIDAAGTRTGLGIGNPNAEFSPNVSVCALASEGGTAKVLWGFRNGEVAVMSASRTMDTRRAAADVLRCALGDEHEGEVLDAVWDDAQTCVATAGVDGLVKVWDARTMACIWTSERKEGTVKDACVKVATAMTNGVVVGVMRSGKVHIWTGFKELVQSLSTGLLGAAEITETTIPYPVTGESDTTTRDLAYEVKALHIDPYSAKPTILAAYDDDCFFHRLHINLATKALETTAFGDASFGPISSVLPVFGDSEKGQQSFVIVGDHIGCVSVYTWNATLRAASTSILPTRKFEAHEDGASVTALHFNDTTLITGSVRGSTHVFDALTFEQLRFFTSPVPRIRGGRIPQGVDPRERESVTQILVGPEKEVLCVAVGDRVLSWRAGSVPKSNSGGVRGRNITGTVSKKKKAAGKYLQQLEMNQTITESKDLLKYEKEHIQRVYGREREQRAHLDTLGLSEVEVVEYVLMLSRDEAMQNRAAGDGLTDQQMSAAIDEGVFEGDFDDIPVAGSSHTSDHRVYSSPLSTSSSSSSLSSRSGVTLSPSGRPVPRMNPSPSNHKVQVSPPFKAEPTEAGSGKRPSSPPKARSPGLPPLESFRLPGTINFPPISASPKSRGMPIASSSKRRDSGGASSHSSAVGSPRSVKSSGSAWNTPLSTPAKSSPATSPPIQRSSWTSRARVSPPMAAVDEMDDDLRFALELSLAEAKSRGEA
ncbi:hypothetical protein BDQ12DRAFT_684853 [Crucibulum laeve]|uniref:F-box domain-containing protein n=1 Tax=Crucibulum laeve TaxID=68775 RepID=A0A5C3LXI6_9AGAR|nr:hypothetical protein BDQ12DRAFT_684853 [Crucibulum laeve]